MRSDIRRSFVDLTAADLADAENLAFLRAMGHRATTGWDELLESRLILLLSEAQSGKTYECQACQQRLWDEGQPAFYIELASVADQPWAELRSPEEDARLERWLRTESEIATLFLDSVDELRLTQGRFRTALRNIAKELAGRVGRVRVVLTSRPLPVDRELFLQTFAVPKSQQALSADDFATAALGQKPDDGDKPAKQTPEVRNVALAPLTQAEMVTIARNQGVTDTDAFLDGLRAASMLDFMSRPQDVISAATAWKVLKGRFGTHAQQVQFDIEERLKPNPKRNDRPLSPARAVDGAKRLALAAALSRCLTIQHDDREAESDDESLALDPAPFLSDWDREDVRALLERGLFGFASYGRVRFHNRFVIDYLAAARLSDLLDDAASERSIRRLLVVRTAQGTDQIRPSLRDVAAWLARLRPWVFDLVKRLEPALLLDLGDPGSFPPYKRREVLSAYIAHYGKGSWRGLHVPRIQVHRFADPSLGATVKAEFAQVENVEVRELLLELIQQAKLADCGEIARTALWSETTGGDERIDALEALIAIDDEDLPRIAEALAVRAQRWGERFTRYAINLLFPNHLTIEQLVRILSWLPETGSTGHELARTLPYLAERLDLAGLRALLTALLPLVEEGLRFDTRLHATEVKRQHLVPLLARICLRLLQQGAVSVDDARVLALASELGRNLRHDELLTDLHRAIDDADPVLRPTIFEAEVAMRHALRPERVSFDTYVELCYRATLTLRFDDDAWLRPCVADAAGDLEARTAALVVEVLDLAHKCPDRTAHLEGLKPLVADSVDMLAYVERYLQPSDHDRHARRWALCDRRAKRKRERQQARDRASWVGFWEELVQDGDAAFTPEHVHNTAWHLWRVMDRTGARNAGSSWNRQLIEDHFDKAMADRLRVALITLWRRERPRTASERAPDERGAYYTRWHFALCAIAAEAEDPDWTRNLTADDAETAVRYALLNMNGFPPWLDTLGVSYPELVERIIGTELSAELALRAVEQSWSMILQNISHASEPLGNLFMPRLRRWLQESGAFPREGDDEAGAATRLGHVVEVMLKFGGNKDRRLLRDQAVSALMEGVNEPFARVWLPALFNLGPAEAVERLEALCADVPVSANSSAVAWMAELFGHRHRGMGINLKQEAMTGDLLLRLVRLAYAHVDRHADAQHEGAYSPDMRDEAETGRDRLLGAILDRGGPDGWTVKMTLASSPEFAHLRDRVHRLAMERAARDAEGQAMDPVDILAFDRKAEPGPRTSGEMFDLMTDRLDDLDDYLLRDDSPIDLWQKITLEKALRREVSRFLAERAHGAYIVSQEGVTADEKETDIRLRSTAAGFEGVFELKVGDKSSYTAASLLKVVREQLVEKYLAPSTRRAGYLVISRAKKERWLAPDGTTWLDFDGLIALLREDARTIHTDFPGELHVDVRGLDLKPRLSTESEAAGKRAEAPAVQRMSSPKRPGAKGPAAKAPCAKRGSAS